MLVILGGVDFNNRVACSWNRTLESDDASLADLDDFKVLHRDTLVTHVTGHASTLEYVLRTTGTDRTWHTFLVLVTVGLWMTVKTMTLHDTLETFALGLANDIDGLPWLKDSRFDRITTLESGITFDTEIAKNAHRRQILQVTCFRLGRVLMILKTDLNGSNAVLFGGFDLRNNAGSSFHERHGNYRAVRRIDLRHLEFFAQNEFHRSDWSRVKSN